MFDKSVPIKVISWTLIFIEVIVLCPILYLLMAFCLSGIPANSNFKQCEKDAVEIYLRTNGVHTDLVVPIRNEIKDWTKLVNPVFTKSTDTAVNYAAFGWGDKGFYLETPEWSDLKFSTAFNALFFLSSTAMHVTFYKGMAENEACKKICISKTDYHKLAAYIEASFEKENGTSLLIAGASYFDHDLFYEAKGTYNLFRTCNTWTNSALKSAGLRACIWTPFDQGIFYHYRR
jgi:uncharacterized protein (TIGR02117 family)